MPKHTKKHHVTSTLSGMLLCIGVACLALSAYLYMSAPKPPRTLQAPATNSQHTGDVEAAPSADKPTAAAIETYTVPADQPKFLDIAKIGVTKARIKALGVRSNNQIATPDNIHDIGWYKNSAKPNETGAMFMYGHVSNWTANGVFYNLKKLKAGDLVTVTQGNDTTYTYKVVSTKTYAYDNVDMSEVLAPIIPGKLGLNLMTCGGKVLKGTSEFSERFVVFTSLQ